MRISLPNSHSAGFLPVTECVVFWYVLRAEFRALRGSRPSTLAVSQLFPTNCISLSAKPLASGSSALPSGIMFDSCPSQVLLHMVGIGPIPWGSVVSDHLVWVSMPTKHFFQCPYVVLGSCVFHHNCFRVLSKVVLHDEDMSAAGIRQWSPVVCSDL